MTTQITPEVRGVWRLRSTISKKAKVGANGKLYIASFDTGKTYTNEHIAVGIQVTNARETWQYGGYLSQEFEFKTESGYRNKNKAFNRTKDLLINDVSIINLPLLRDGNYRLRFFLATYFQDIKLQIWEYTGKTTNKLINDLSDFLANSPADALINLPEVNQKLDKLLNLQQSAIAVDLITIEAKLDALLKCINCDYTKPSDRKLNYYTFLKLMNLL